MYLKPQCERDRRAGGRKSGWDGRDSEINPLNSMESYFGYVKMICFPDHAYYLLAILSWQCKWFDTTSYSKTFFFPEQWDDECEIGLNTKLLLGLWGVHTAPFIVPMSPFSNRNLIFTHAGQLSSLTEVSWFYREIKWKKSERIKSKQSIDTICDYRRWEGFISFPLSCSNTYGHKW